MSATININDLTLAHKGSSGVSMATIPDVCKTPSPAGPVPIPYPNIAMSADLKKGTKTIKADGGNMAANKGSELSRSSGDEAGVTGGVKSSTNMKEATWMLYSFDVMLEGKNACRLTDKLFMNHQNTVCLAGWVQEFFVDGKGMSMQDACKAAREYIEDMIGEGRTGEGKRHYTQRGLEERINQNKGIGISGRDGPPSPPGTPGWKNHDEEITKLKNDINNKVDAFEEECEDYGRRDTKKFIKNSREAADQDNPTKEDWTL